MNIFHQNFRQEDDVVEADFLDFYKYPYKKNRTIGQEKKKCGQYLQYKQVPKIYPSPQIQAGVNKLFRPRWPGCYLGLCGKYQREVTRLLKNLRTEESQKSNRFFLESAAAKKHKIYMGK